MESAQDELKFQDFSAEAKVAGVKEEVSGNARTYNFTHFTSPDEEATADNLKNSQSSPYTFEYYQQLFDVETDQVLTRVFNSMIPRLGSNFITQYVRPAADLWGPFWICATLVFSTAVSGNIYNYLAADKFLSYAWNYDFAIVSQAAAAIFAYAWLLPLLLWGFLAWRKTDAGYTYVEMLCLYGYSLSVYIPVSILWIIPFEVLQWILIAVGSFLSGAVLLMAIYPALKNDNKIVMAVTLVLIAFLHAALAIGFKTYFFHGPGDQSHRRTAAPPAAATIFGNSNSTGRHE